MQVEQYTVYFLPKVEIKYHNVTINGQNFFDQPVKNNLRTYDKFEKLQLVKEMITQLVVC